MPDQIMRFECIFAKRNLSKSKKGFIELKRSFEHEINKDHLNLQESGFRELD